MAQPPIGPINADLRLAQLLGNDQLLAAVPPAIGGPTTGAPVAAGQAEFSGNAFDDLLAKAINSLNDVSRSEAYTNRLIDQYTLGQVELQDVMVAQAKMSVASQLAVTTINSAVNTFKEITQMQI
jgi:flagellar hook-basal body complex protein FliE